MPTKDLIESREQAGGLGVPEVTRRLAGSSPVVTTEDLPTIVLEARRGLLDLDFQSIWERRELLYFLVWRDLKVRYKQTAIGASWAILSPLLTVLIFTVVFGHFAKIPSDGMPYVIFALAGFLPWTYFAQALGRSSGGLVGNAHLISKVYFPRLLLPLASITTPAVDFCLSLVGLLGLMIWFRITPTLSILALPLFLLLAALIALAVGLWLAPLNVRYRDVNHAVPFLVQIWMYASPVVYPLTLVPEEWRHLFSLNPMVGVIEGFRWCLLGTKAPDMVAIGLSVFVVLPILLGGLVFFRRMERRFADII